MAFQSSNRRYGFFGMQILYFMRTQTFYLICLRIINKLFSDLSFAWFKDTYSDFIRPEVKWYTFVSNDGKLYFQFVTKNDAGDYYCVVTRPDTGDDYLEEKISKPIPLQITETGLILFSVHSILEIFE